MLSRIADEAPLLGHTNDFEIIGPGWVKKSDSSFVLKRMDKIVCWSMWLMYTHLFYSILVYSMLV